MANAYITCGHCKASFPAPEGFGRQVATDVSTLRGNAADCPNCASTGVIIRVGPI